jgi:hypothetical protein
MNAAVVIGIIALLIVIIGGAPLSATAPSWMRADGLLPLRRRFHAAGDGSWRPSAGRAEGWRSSSAAPAS